ncbi:MAG: M20 family metallopeptidase [Candidatus Nitricoxidivorans perseverans]|uniref:M20 family metallopeptidase n=1 Tax=Candidatus Nitricoxidivorans perseverans TaxID=2975601 RepID=A0AA49IWL2_9PROT|nr:MAG: M20 family metallopeptidase [Candidatus Nitricoxidivorans perseverans]
MDSEDISRTIAEIHPRIAALRRDLHAHPELAFGERRTSDIVAAHLEELGIETHRGLAGTGVVGRLSSGAGSRAIGLRADMDALPLAEQNAFAHRSTCEGRMHACGHDGHTAMLLGAAEALAARRDRFDGTIYFVFQPAEEHEGGGRVMVEEGLFNRFPMDMVFGLHNWPGLPAGGFGVIEGPVMAGADRFEITLTGHGAHAAMPHQGTDTVLAGAALVQALQAVVSRDTDPVEPAVVSVTRFHAGHADNVLPETAVLGGTVRCFRPELQDALEDGMRRICRGIGAAHRVEVRLDFMRGYPPTINAAEPAALCREVARRVVDEVAGKGAGGGQVFDRLKPSMGAEDFSFLSRVVPGCYAWLGNGPVEGGRMLHSPRYDFNDAIIPVGIRYWVRLAESALPPA